VFGETSLILFLTASLALIIHPGPNMIYIVTRGVSQGRGAALVSVMGMGTGQTVHTVFAALGLSAILQQSTTAFMVVKYVGAAYLIYLGVRTLLSKRDLAAPEDDKPPIGLLKVYRQGAALSVFNPYLALFFLAYLPQFANPAANSVALQLIVLGLLYTLLALVVYGAIAYFSGSLGNRLATSPRFSNALRWLTGSVLVSLGLRLAFSDRR
jgi:threonine/homoserine/homoserine lactone efflux protein